jgi:hypothetical protein
VPLYYAGLEKTAVFKEKAGKAQKLKLNRNYEASLEVEIPAEGYTWFVIE